MGQLTVSASCSLSVSRRMHVTHLDGAWPQQYARSIVPYSLFDETLLLGKQGKGRKIRGLLDLDPPPAFDLVIVDEAHHIRNTDTWAYRTVRYFCDNAEAVVLLSATPIQLGDNDLFTLLQLVRHDLLPSRRDFDHMAEPNPQRRRMSDSDKWLDLPNTSMNSVANLFPIPHRPTKLLI